MPAVQDVEDPVKRRGTKFDSADNLYEDGLPNGVRVDGSDVTVSSRSNGSWTGGDFSSNNDSMMAQRIWPANTVNGHNEGQR